MDFEDAYMMAVAAIPFWSGSYCSGEVVDLSTLVLNPRAVITGFCFQAPPSYSGRLRINLSE